MGTTIADLAQQAALANQKQEAQRMASGGQGDPTGAVQYINELVQGGNQNPPLQGPSGDPLGGLASMLAPLFTSAPPQPVPQQQATPAPDALADEIRRRNRLDALAPQAQTGLGQ